MNEKANILHDLKRDRLDPKSKIAEMLFLSSHTITTHRKNIMSKLGVKNTAGIVMYAVKSGIVSPNKFLFAS